MQKNKNFVKNTDFFLKMQILAKKVAKIHEKD